MAEKEELVLDSGVGSSVASSDSTSDEHLQTTANATRIIHVHTGLSRRLSSPNYSPPVQQFRRQTLEIDNLPPATVSKTPAPMNGESSKKCQSWLLRLFESKMFDASMAVHYLFNSKEPGVLGYLGNRLFTLDDEDVEFFLPQLVNMYVQHHEVAEVIHPYLVHRCRTSVDFSLQCAWLLEAYTPIGLEGKKSRSHGSKLKNLILSGELVPKEMSDRKLIVANSGHKRTHIRSRSDASALISASGKGPLFSKYPGRNGLHPNGPSMMDPVPLKRLTLGDLTSGRAFDNGCICFDAYKIEINDLRGRKTYCKIFTRDFEILD